MNASSIHPGDILKYEFMEPLNLDAKALIQLLDMPSDQVMAIINETDGISPKMAQRLSAAFGTTPEFWMNLQAQHDLQANVL